MSAPSSSLCAEIRSFHASDSQSRHFLASCLTHRVDAQRRWQDGLQGSQRR
jgi:hypothetical protein